MSEGVQTVCDCFSIKDFRRRPVDDVEARVFVGWGQRTPGKGDESQLAAMTFGFLHTRL